MAEALKIAVRVRPFNDKENAANQELCIEMTDVKVTVNDHSGQKEPKHFTFDHAFWSHDGFEIGADGYAAPKPGTTKYTDQKQVWDKLGSSVLDKAWQGYNNTIFAYGQTGAGKSYSIFGYPGNAGIIPIAAEKLFERIQAETDANIRYEVTVQMVEIYMEKIQDLLVPAAKRKTADLPIKQSANGVYVQGATKTPVTNYNDIQRVIDFGEKNRTLGATEMNKTSSRSHTVVTVHFNKITKMAGKEGRLSSMINIVDLAGSEKSTQAGTTGDRLAEGNAINKSLSCLGNVIEVLADHSMGKNLKRVVPYRDSKLTRMLQDALGGDCVTIMICAIRPGYTYYEETLATLRYADRAKKIKNKPTINEDPQAKLIRELQEENKRLRDELAAGGGGGGGGGAAGYDPEAAKRLAEAEEQIRKNQQEMDDMAKSWEQKLHEQQSREQEEEQKKREIEEAKKSGNPQILNLNEDGMLDRKIFLDLTKNANAKVGRKQQNPAENPEICLGGIGIQSQHANFVTNGDRTQLVPISQEAAEHTYINGDKLTSTAAVELKPNDRIIFGTGTVLLYRCQNRDSEVTLRDDPDNPITYEMAMEEKRKIEDAEEDARRQQEKERQEAEAAAKMEELRVKLEAEKAEQEAMRLQMQKEMEEQMAKLKAEVDAKRDDEAAQREAQEREAKLRIEMEYKLKQDELEAQRKEAERQERIRQEEQQMKLRQAENSALESQLEEILPLVREANLIAGEFSRDIRFNSQLASVMPDFEDLKVAKREFQIKIDNREDGYFYVWDPAKFQNRVELIRNQFNDYVESGGEMPDFTNKEQDPFWDPPEPQLIGKTFLQLQHLGYMLDNDVKAAIYTADTGAQGAKRGDLILRYKPCDIHGDELPEEDLIEEPNELLGKELCFQVEIDKAEGLPNDLCKDVFVTYIMKYEPHITHRIPNFDGKNPNPVFNYKKVHRIDCVTDFILQNIEKGTIVFKTYANPLFGGATIQASRSPTPTKSGALAAQSASGGGQAGSASASAAPMSGSAPQGVAKGAPVKAAAATQQAASKPAETKPAEASGSSPAAETTAQTGGNSIAVVGDKKGSSCCSIF